MTTPDLTGQTVVSVGYEGALYVDTDRGWQVAVESDFSTVSRDGQSWSKADGALDEMVGLLRQQVGQRITAFEIAATGTLHLTIGPYAVIAPPSPRYESWSVAGPGKELVVCLPGGGLAVWD
jgi:hypothetical protein